MARSRKKKKPHRQGRKRSRRMGRGTHVTFLGAAQEVTGSCYLIETSGLRFLIDCGMVQGGGNARKRNERDFDFRPEELDFVLLSHAHIDHSGLLPRLVAEGFGGTIYTTGASLDLVHLLLEDTADLQERDEDVVSLYTQDDVSATIDLIQPIAYDELFEPAPLIEARFRDAGHILGSSIVEIWSGHPSRRTKIVFSGDLGQPGRPLIRNPTKIDAADLLLMESTYGNRDHKNLDRSLDELVEVVKETLEERRGNVIIPTFAIGRAQELLFHFRNLTRHERLCDLEIFIDSPMAAEATRITINHADLFNPEAMRLVAEDDPDAPAPRIRFVGSVAESRGLDKKSGVIIMAGSGMCEGGRIRQHLADNLPRPESTILFPGFQAAGTLGRELVDGAETVALFGEEVPVRARICTLGGFSAHADRSALIEWARGFEEPPRKTYLVHGEPRASRSLAKAISSELGFDTSAPSRNTRIRVPS